MPKVEAETQRERYKRLLDLCVESLKSQGRTEGLFIWFATQEVAYKLVRIAAPPSANHLLNIAATKVGVQQSFVSTYRVKNIQSEDLGPHIAVVPGTIPHQVPKVCLRMRFL